MRRIDIETKRKLREMGVATLLDAFDAQDDVLTLGLAFEEKIKLAVDDAHSVFTQTKVEGLIRRANLRYPNADLHRLDLVEERGLDRSVIAGLGTCSFIDRQQNVVFQGFTGSGKSYLGCALAKAACLHRVRAHYIRMPELEEAWQLARDKPSGQTKFLNKYSSFTLLVIDEWLLDEPDESTRSMLLELLERRYDQTSTVFCTQYAQRDWHQRLGSGVHADAIMDRIVHNTLWVETGGHNMREHTASQAKPRHNLSRGRASMAPNRATARPRKAIPVAPEGNIHWPLHRQILNSRQT
ncbi:ATP-binding protein [Subtercola vilae]|uniref:ATP-binding protein n=1 Tax=Subtercola vilae TaxID=2056433 RepID=A0A4T2BYA2_9MICO|nr:ATP-binding protein [Subtercola vilae]TIH35591.1 ATP-binding protein [Subtercola vilae]